MRLLPAVGVREQRREEDYQRGSVAPHVVAVGYRQEVPAVAVEAACPRATFVAKEL
jgi:hypothetical protein